MTGATGNAHTHILVEPLSGKQPATSQAFMYIPRPQTVLHVKCVAWIAALKF